MSYEAPNNTSKPTICKSPTKGLRLASLFSGGKDSTYATYIAQQPQYGQHEISCLVSLFGYSDESMLLHNPNIRWVRTQAQLMHNMPLLTGISYTDDTQNELDVLESLLLTAKSTYKIQGVVHGAIRSEFQRSRFASVCKKIGLKVIEPLWGKASLPHMTSLVDDGFDVIITSVSAGGLDESWLGHRITHKSIDILAKLSKKYGFSLDFEGGEAETFVTNCPLFKHQIIISNYNITWDGYRGRFEILETTSDSHA